MLPQTNRGSSIKKVLFERHRGWAKFFFHLSSSLPPYFLYSDHALRGEYTMKPEPAAECARNQHRLGYSGAESVTEAVTNQLCFHSFITGRRQSREEKVVVITFKLAWFKL